MWIWFKRCGLLLLVCSLVACGGTTSPDDDGTDPGSGGSASGGSGSGGGAADTSTGLRIGSFDDGGDFQSGMIAASRTDLEAGESASLSVALVEPGDNTVADDVSVSFTSPCASDDLAEFEPAVGTTSGGRLNSTYTARGCNGSDKVAATAVVDGATLQAEATISAEAAPPGSIAFDSVDNPLIGIQGTGGSLPEQAKVAFTVTNSTGGPAPNQTVDFRLNTTTGGIRLSNRQAVTDSNGQLSTTVTSGSVATSVRVTASAINAAGETLSSQSNALAITTGVPDNDSFSVGAATPNIEGWDRNNVTTEVTALLADRFNNPVPDGTAVTFTAEGGSIGGSCQTEDGQCSVTFRSQDPRPADGRVTVLASAIGEESFADGNGNGRYDSGEKIVDDLPEAFRDDNENGSRESNEPFLDFNDDQNYTPASANFTGVLCNSACDDAASLNVRQSLVIVLSGSTYAFDVSPDPIHVDNGVQTVTVRVSDERGNLPAKGTTVSVEATQGSIIGQDSYTQPAGTGGDGRRGGRFAFRLEPGSEPGNGILLITAQSPSGTMSQTQVSIVQN